MDMIVGLPPSADSKGNAYDAILVVVDRFTKMAKYFPIRETMAAPQLAELFCNEIVKQYGTPRSIVTDRGSIFTSEYWSMLCYYMKVKRKLSTAFHPQTDGQTECQNQVLEHYLRAYADYRQDNWVSMLPAAEYAYNNSTHAVIGISPFYALYGLNPELAWDVEGDTPKGEAPAARERAKQMIAIREPLQERLRTAAEIQAKYYNKSHMAKTYNVGDMVLLSTKNIRLAHPSKKLNHHFAGPF